ncbi:hypothetical protein [Marinactinospora rubrisoli]|uniref:Serine/arginine repetitive matrix protein 2 n=1 Tax=Marinactinospora rubrisoli TaxID=2715399 RepID=A0ABW2KN86_9ACTN
MSQPARPDPAEVRPRRLWFWIGGLVIVLGVVGAVVALFVGAFRTTAADPPVVGFRAGEEAAFTAESGNTDSDTWRLYADRELSFDEVERACAVTGEAGDVVIRAPGYTSTTTVNGVSRVLVAEIGITEPGGYTIACAADSGAAFSVSYGAGAATVVFGILGTLGSVFLFLISGLVIGIVLIVTTAVRRGGHRRRLAAERARWGGGPGMPPGAPHM